jgi:hypothetical protein
MSDKGPIDVDLLQGGERGSLRRDKSSDLIRFD